MTSLMFEVGAVWLAALLAGLPLFASMGLAAFTAAAATIGPIIPPSLRMVIFGVTADVSIGRLFMAGVIPGVLMGLSLMVMVAMVAKREGFPSQPSVGLRGLIKALRDSFWA